MSTTEIVILLDRSGSMGRLRDDTIGGFNTLIEDQKKETSTKCLVTLVQFDDKYEVNYFAKPIEDVEPLTEETYQPRGTTALHDAIGKTINGITNRHASMAEKPDQVLFVITTDGFENSSMEFKGKAKEMILGQEDWDFLYLGAGIDEVATAAEYGIPINTVSNYDNSSAGIGSTYVSTSNLIRETRTSYSAGNSRRRMRSVAEDVEWKANIDGSQEEE